MRWISATLGGLLAIVVLTTAARADDALDPEEYERVSTAVQSAVLEGCVHSAATGKYLALYERSADLAALDDDLGTGIAGILSEELYYIAALSPWLSHNFISPSDRVWQIGTIAGSLSAYLTTLAPAPCVVAIAGTSDEIPRRLMMDMKEALSGGE